MPINPDDLSDAEHAAIKAAMRYWIEHWDWECPTLFGLEKMELQQVLDLWPEVEAENEKNVALAINGAFRELLYGASSVSRKQLQEICGLSNEAVDELSKRVFERVSNEL